MSRKHRTGQAGKGRPTPPRSPGGAKSRPAAGRSSGRRSSTGPVYRQRRFPPMPVWLKALLAAVWLTALVAVLVLVDSGTGRVGLMIAVTFTLPLIVVFLRDPARRTRR